MSIFEAFILGIIQGLTEFLPVSSSGHLTLAQYFLGFDNPSAMIPFDLACHMGTLGAILIVFNKQIKALANKGSKTLWQIAIGTLPLFPALIILKQIESLYDRLDLIGIFFLITALLLWLGALFGYDASIEKRKEHWALDSLIIGIFQTLALLPGVSRSGSTISSARMLGWKTDEAVSFSFLLAIPAILGGTLLKLTPLFSISFASAGQQEWKPHLIGFATAFISGVFALKILIRLAANQKMVYFAWYCLLVAIGCLYYFE